MVLAPLIVGLWIVPLQILHVAFGVAWVAAYLAYLDFQGWLRARGRRRRRFVAPLVTYGSLAAAAGAVVVVARPALIRLAPVLAVLLTISVVCVARGAVRSALNDLVAQASACLSPVMVAVIAAPAGGLRGGWLGLCVGSGPGDGGAWLASVCLFAYFAGTTFYVKTMIRQRGKLGWYVASVGYHAVVVAAAWVFVAGAVRASDATPGATGLEWLLAAMATALLARAAAMPQLWPDASPRKVGVGEVLATLVLMVMVIGLA
jgi:hypothetical protein